MAYRCPPALCCRAAIALLVSTTLAACGTPNDGRAVASGSSANVARSRPDESAIRPSALSDSASGRNNSGRVADAAPTVLAGTSLDDAGMLAAILTVDRAEADVGRLASAKGRSEEVKAFSREMTQAHVSDLSDVQRIAHAGHFTLRDSNSRADAPVFADLTRMHSEAMGRLRAVSGVDFDRAYIAGQISAHEKMLGILRSNVAALQDPSVKAHVMIALDVINEHLEKARAIQARFNTLQ